MMRYPTLFLIAALGLALAACGAQAPASATAAAPIDGTAMSAGPLEIRDIWARSAPARGGAEAAAAQPTSASMDATPAAGMAMKGEAAGPVGAAYMTIRNTSATPDQLIKAAGDVAAAIELHTMVNNNGVIEMRPVEQIEVPANGEVQLKPGGLHIMLIGLTRELKPGDQVPLTLTFAQAGTIQVNAVVRATQ